MAPVPALQARVGSRLPRVHGRRSLGRKGRRACRDRCHDPIRDGAQSSAELQSSRSGTFPAGYSCRIRRQRADARLVPQTDGSRLDSPVAMGGIGPDTGRNVAGLRNAVSFLLETRGVGLGRAHFVRRVHTHVVAAEAILELAAANSGTLMALTQKAAAEASSSTSPLVIVAHQRPEKREMTFIDFSTGTDKPVSVTWLSSLQIEPVLTRSRPAGYLLSGATPETIEILRAQGSRCAALTKAATIEAIRYRVDAIAAGRQRGRTR